MPTSRQRSPRHIWAVTAHNTFKGSCGCIDGRRPACFMISPGLAVRHSHILEFASAGSRSCERNTSASRQNHLFTMSDKTGRTPLQAPANLFLLRTARTAQGHAPRKGRSPGGARRDRTDDLMLAKHALSQLSYGPLKDAPNWTSDNGGPGKT